MNKLRSTPLYIVIICVFMIAISACKTKRHSQQTANANNQTDDSLQGKCRLLYKTAKALTKHIKENELNYSWISAKADVETTIDGEDHNLDIRVKGRKDSALWISITAVGLIDVAKILITRDSVKMVVYIKKQYFTVPLIITAFDY